MPRKIYTEKHIEWLKKNVPGNYLFDTLILFNRKFNLNMTYSALKSLTSRFKIQSGMKCKIKPETKISKMLLTPDELKIFEKNNWHKTAKEMVDFCKNEFNKVFTTNQIKQIRQKNHFISGFTGRFSKGQIPPNKGRKGFCFPGCEKTWFKKGSKPANTMPIGTEITTKDGYIKIKTADPNKWEYKHRLTWEQHNGKLPKNKICVFLDGNKKNCSIENLCIIDRKTQIRMNQKKLFTESKELTYAALQMVKLQAVIYSKENEF